MADFMNTRNNYSSLLGYTTSPQPMSPQNVFGIGDAGVTGAAFTAPADIAAATQPQGWWDNLTSSFFRSKDPTSGIETGGWGSAGMGILQGLGNAYMGSQQLKYSKDTLKEGKRQFNLNYGAQKVATNNDIDSRNFARNAANPGAYQPLNRIA